MYIKHPALFYALVSAVLLLAALVVYFVGVPIAEQPYATCGVFGCTTLFGFFIVAVLGISAVAIGLLMRWFSAY
ncbi:MAG: hypothetical protein VYC42_02000 [Pseudomonadota bacterium]|nr:hypothetical protein [Pseudomonadota bacterium]